MGSFIGVAYWERRYEDFERFLQAVITLASATPTTRCSVADGEVVQWRFGFSHDTPLLFAINEGARSQLAFSATDQRLLGCDTATELARNESVVLARSEGQVRFELELAAGEYRFVRFDASKNT